MTVPPLKVLEMLVTFKVPGLVLVNPPVPEIRLGMVTDPPPVPPKVVMAARLSGASKLIEFPLF